MVKKAALSVRISESTKKALDKAAAKDRRSTAALVDIILQDWVQSQLTGAPMKYSPDARAAAGESLMDMIMPNGKPLGECTGEEVAAIGEAFSSITDEQARSALLAAMVKVSRKDVE